MVRSFTPASLREALEILANERDVTPYAGGTDLMIEAAEDRNYLFIGKLPELRRMEDDGEWIRIGAACTFTEVLEHPLTPAILREAVAKIAAPAIRNLGTMGGNLGNGSPKADTALVEYACDAKLRLVSVRGERTVAVDQFYQGRKALDLAPDELIAEVLLPRRGLENYYYQKVGARQALAISRVSFAGVFAEADGKITNVAAAFGAVADTVLRFRDLEARLIGKTKAEAAAEKEAYLDAYAQAIVPIRGRVSSAYRKRVCLNLLRDFLETNGI